MRTTKGYFPYWNRLLPKTRQRKFAQQVVHDIYHRSGGGAGPAGGIIWGGSPTTLLPGGTTPTTYITTDAGSILTNDSGTRIKQG